MSDIEPTTISAELARATAAELRAAVRGALERADGWAGAGVRAG